MKKFEKIGLFTLIACLFLIVISANAYAMISYYVDHSPEEPVAGSEISFTVTFDNNSSVEEVNLRYHECEGSVCSINVGESLTHSGSGVYEGDINLENKKATYVEYRLEITSKGTAESSNWTKIYLKADSSTDTNNSDDDNAIPGFEVLIVLSILLVTVVVFKRVKRQ